MRTSRRFTLSAIAMMVFLGNVVLAHADDESTSEPPKQYYGAELCNYEGFKCVKLSRSSRWDKMFPNLRERELVKRLNRTNMPLYMRPWIVVPTNLQNLTHMDIAPFKLQYDTQGHRTILVDLSLHAFGAYDKNGTLVHWGPISGGKDYCKDIDGPCRTITGDFKITRKDSEECESGQFPKDTEGGAPMPYCMHFYKGFALHGSTLPGYHGSHGCVRLFFDDAKWLNKHFTQVGTRVIVTN